MKYSSIVKFIKSYMGHKSLDSALEAVIGLEINKERLEIYEKLLIYCPELSEKSINYLKERTAKNVELVAKREKMLKNLNMSLEKEKKEGVSYKLETWLEGKLDFTGPVTNTDGRYFMSNENLTAFHTRIRGEFNQPPTTTPGATYLRHVDTTGIAGISPRQTDEQLDIETIREFSNYITNGSIRVYGDRYMATLPSGRKAYFNPQGQLLEVV